MSRTIVCEDCWKPFVDEEQLNPSALPLCDECYVRREKILLAYRAGSVSWERFQYATKGLSRRQRMDEVLRELEGRS